MFIRDGVFRVFIMNNMDYCNKIHQNEIARFDRYEFIHSGSFVILYLIEITKQNDAKILQNV